MFLEDILGCLVVWGRGCGGEDNLLWNYVSFRLIINRCITGERKGWVLVF